MGEDEGTEEVNEDSDPEDIQIRQNIEKKNF